MLHDSKFILISKQAYNIHSYISDFVFHPGMAALVLLVNSGRREPPAPRGARRSLLGQEAS